MKTWEFAIQEMNGQDVGSALIRYRDLGKKKVTETRMVLQNQRKTIISYQDSRGLVRGWVETVTSIRGKKWFSRTWITRAPRGIEVRHNKLNETWQESYRLPRPATVMGLGVLPIFMKGRSFGIYHIDGNWIGAGSFRKEKNGRMKMIATSKNSFVVPNEDHLEERHDREGPIKITFPHQRIEFIRTQTQIVKFPKLSIPRQPALTIQPKNRNRLTKEKKLVFPSGFVRLAGSLETDGKDTGLPVVILVHGSGAETGDSGCGYEGRDMVHSAFQPFRWLSRQLATQRIPVFRYDKRGIGNSSGNWFTAGFKDLQNDLESAVRFIHTTTKKQVVLAGFSEGAALAVEVAAALNKEILGVILAAGPARTIDHVILSKMDRKYRLMREPPQHRKEVVDYYREMFQRIRSIDKHRRGKRIEFAFEGKSFDWWAQHLKARAPKERIKRLSVPVLLLHGRDDLEVLVDECRMMAKALERARIPHEMHLLKGLNHFFTKACLEFPGFEYDIPYEMSKAVPHYITHWIKKLGH